MLYMFVYDLKKSVKKLIGRTLKYGSNNLNLPKIETCVT